MSEKIPLSFHSITMQMNTNFCENVFMHLLILQSFSVNVISMRITKHGSHLFDFTEARGEKVDASEG